MNYPSLNVNGAKVKKTNETSTSKYNIVSHVRLTFPLQQLQKEQMYYKSHSVKDISESWKQRWKIN